jgi:Predicted dioxygenase
MPYGKEEVDTEFGKTLVESYPELFSDDRSPHLNEHSIEVQLPFYIMS